MKYLIVSTNQQNIGNSDNTNGDNKDNCDVACEENF